MYQPNYGYQYPYLGTQPPVPDNLAQLRMNQTQMQSPVVTAPAPTQTQPNNSLIWVQGETGAKSYLVAPNNTIMLMDSEGDRFYLKSADASGMPLPLRVFEYKEITNAPKNDFNAPVSVFNDQEGKYVTREEFERRMADIAAQTAKIANEPQPQTKKGKNNLTEVAESV